MRCREHKKGQAVLELAIFGSLILLVFGVLLSYLQRMNDQQYVQMETFRRTLARACTYSGNTSGGAGASVSLTNLENRRQVDLTSGFKKGSAQTMSASNSVLWAVPEGGEDSENLVLLRVNQDETQIDSNATVEDINFSTNTSFAEANTKEETPAGITTTRSSTLEDTITTTFLAENGTTIWEVSQGAYQDAGGQYRYDSAHVGTEINQRRTWETGF